MEQRKSDFLKMFNSYDIFYDRTRKCDHLNGGNYLIEVTTWAGLTIYMQDSDRRPVSDRRPIHKSASNSQIYGRFSLSQIDVQLRH